MKKFFATVALFALLLSLTACGGNNSTPSSAQTSSQPESSQAEPSSTTSSGTSASSSEPEAASSVPEETPAESTPEEPSTEDTSAPEAAATGSNILIAYFSRVGNMNYDPNVDAITSASVNLNGNDIAGNAQLLAGMAQEITGGDLFFIETTEKYPSAYRATTDQARTEQNDDTRPELVSHVENMDGYDTVVLIYPNWWGTLPQAVMTFLEEYDFTGKTIYPLCTHEGSAMGRSESDLARLAPGAQIENGLAVRGGSAASAKGDVEGWLSAIRSAEQAAG